MKHHLRWAARLYPRVWRERYGEEFAALLEDVRPTWRDAGDIVLGAFKVHLSTGGSFLKLAAVMAAVGVVLGAAASLTTPKRHISTGVVRVESQPGAEDSMRAVVTQVLSRGSLAEIIQRPSLDLYKTERQRYPMEDVVEEMRKKHIRIAPRADGAIEISFAYDDAAKADGTARVLMNRVAAAIDAVQRQRASVWQKAWPNDPPPPGQKVVLLSEPLPPALAGAPLAPFLAGGAALGLLAAWLAWRPKRNLRLAGFALAGGIAASAASFAISNRYTSTAVLRITPPFAPPRIYNAFAPTVFSDELRHLQEYATSDQTLTGLIESRRLQLYFSERQHRPLPEVVRIMRDRDLRIAQVGSNAFAISFTYVDRYKAQQTVREVLTLIVERYVLEQRALGQKAEAVVQRAYEFKAGPNLEVLDPATLPETPVFPHRLAIGALGVPVGLLAGVYLQRRRRTAQPA
jgi:hypothetical protein